MLCGRFDTPTQWGKLASLLNAAIDAVNDAFVEGEAPAIIIHTDHGGNKEACFLVFWAFRRRGGSL